MTVIGKLGIYLIAIGVIKIIIFAMQYLLNSRNNSNV